MLTDTFGNSSVFHSFLTHNFSRMSNCSCIKIVYKITELLSRLSDYFYQFIFRFSDRVDRVAQILTLLQWYHHLSVFVIFLWPVSPTEIIITSKLIRNCWHHFSFEHKNFRETLCRVSHFIHKIKNWTP